MLGTPSATAVNVSNTDLVHGSFLVAIALVSWMVAHANPSSLLERRIRLRKVNAGVICCSFIAVYFFALHIADVVAPRHFVGVLYLIGGITLSAILWYTPTFYASRTVRAVFRTVALAAVPVWIASRSVLDLGIRGMARLLDGFLLETFGFGRFSAAHAVGMALIFLYSFAVTSYYGLGFRIHASSRANRAEARESLFESDVVDKSIAIAAIGASTVVTLLVGGVDIGSVTIFSGVIVAALTLSLRELLSNLVAGLILMWDRSILKGDVVALSDQGYGKVEEVSIRYVRIKDRNDVNFLIPSSQMINSTVTNWSKVGQLRLKLDVGVSYDVQFGRMDEVRNILMSAAAAHSRVLRDPPPRALVLALADSAIMFQLRFYISDPQNGVRNVMSDLYESIVARFVDRNIQIPFPQRVLHLARPQQEPDGLNRHGLR